MTTVRNAQLDSSLIISKEEIQIDTPKPHSAFTLMATLKDIRQEVVMEKAQLAYMEAHISYPRSDQQVLGRTGLYTVASMIDSYHLGNRLKKDWHIPNNNEKESWVQGAHSALYPLSDWIPPVDKDSCLVESEIVARAMASLMNQLN